MKPPQHASNINTNNSPIPCPHSQWAPTQRNPLQRERERRGNSRATIHKANTYDTHTQHIVALCAEQYQHSLSCEVPATQIFINKLSVEGSRGGGLTSSSKNSGRKASFSQTARNSRRAERYRYVFASSCACKMPVWLGVAVPEKQRPPTWLRKLMKLCSVMRSWSRDSNELLYVCDTWCGKWNRVLVRWCSVARASAAWRKSWRSK